MAKKVTTTPTTEHTRQFVKLFEKLRYRHSAMTAFSDWLTVTAISISNTVNPNQEREQQYQRIIKNYNVEEQEIFAQMLAEVLKEMQPATGVTPHYEDVIGGMFEDLNLTDDWKAQFFTSQNVSDMCGLITISNFEPSIEKHGYATLLEPCVGGGSMVLGIINAMFQRGYNPRKQLLITAYDLDERCVHMSYIQLSLSGVPAMIQRRNTLTNETYGDYWLTPVFVLDDWAGRLRFERKAKAMMSILKDIETPKEKAVAEIKTPSAVKPAPIKTEQLSLF